jgi:hypothetical protein
LGVRPIWDRKRDHRRLRLHPSSAASRSTRRHPRLATSCRQAKATSGSAARPACCRRASAASVIANRSSQDRAAQLLLGSRGVGSPELVEADHRLGQLRGGPQHRVRDHRRQPYLQALDVPAAPSDVAGREADGEAAALLPAAGVVDEDPVAEVQEQRDRRVRDHLKVDGVLRLITESGHADPGHPARPRRDRDVPRRRGAPSRWR